MKKLFPIVVMLLLAASCKIPFDFESEKGPCIYVQAIAQEESVLIAPYYAAAVNRDSEKESLRQVQVEALRNGAPCSHLLKLGDVFSARWDSPLQEGDEISVTVRADGMETVGGSTRFPRALVVEDMQLTPVQVDTIHATEVALTLDHAPGEGEYFGIQIFSRTTVTYMNGKRDTLDVFSTPGYILTAAESVNFDLEDFVQVNYNGLTLGGSQFMPLTLVTKKQFDGPVYKFYLNSFDAGMLNGIRENMPGGQTGMAGGGIVSGEITPGGKPEVDPGKVPVSFQTYYLFHLYSLSREFYQYAKTLYQSNFDFLSNMGFTPANFTWSNVSGGLGFVGAHHSVTLGPVEIEENKNKFW